MTSIAKELLARALKTLVEIMIVSRSIFYDVWSQGLQPPYNPAFRPSRINPIKALIILIVLD